MERMHAHRGDLHVVQIPPAAARRGAALVALPNRMLQLLVRCGSGKETVARHSQR